MKDQGTNCATVDICPDLLIAGIFIAGAAAFLLLYQTITMVGRRKKRGLMHELNLLDIFEKYDEDYVYHGTVFHVDLLDLNYCKLNYLNIYLRFYV